MIRIHNHSPHHFTGWKRITSDFDFTALAYGSPIAKMPTLIVGDAIGSTARVVDVLVDLAPGEKIEVNLAQLVSLPTPPKPSFDPLTFGLLTVNGVMLRGQSVGTDGAAIVAHFRGRLPGTMFVVDVWLRHYPGETWVHGEAMVCCSNPAVVSLTQTTSAPITIKFGNAVVLPLGGTPGELVPAGVTFGDGQARVIPFVGLTAFTPSALAAASMHVCGTGIEKLLPNGNPHYPMSFDAAAWTHERISESIRRLHTWDVGVVGPTAVSGNTGAQEDQIFKRGEALLPDGTGAELIAYLGALKMANRPCHHREVGGEWLMADRHPQLILWDGRPHWHTGVSPDRLGKPQDLTPGMANGWWGPDVEHWLISTLVAGARLTGSPALQALLNMQALIYPLQWTVAPGYSTSAPYASRAIGYEAMNAVLMWQNLKDGQAANRVRTHWRARWEIIAGYLSVAWVEFGAGIIDVRFDDPRLGTGGWWLPWQQALAAYGLDLAGEHFDVMAARAAALQLADKVVNHAYYQPEPDAPWLSYSMLALDGRTNPENIYFGFGTPLAVGVLLRHDPNHGRARSIWSQLKATTRTETASWLVPGIE